MDKQQLKIEASTRLEELLTKAEAAKVVDGQIEATKLDGVKKVEALSVQLVDVNEALKGAGTIEIARQAKNTIDSFKDDIELQKSLNTNNVESKKTELNTVVTEFFDAYKALKTSYTALDTEVALTINIRSLDEDEQTMRNISFEAENALREIKNILIKHGVIKQGEHLYKSFHLNQAPLDAYAKYVNVLTELKPTKANLASQGIK